MTPSPQGPSRNRLLTATGVVATLSVFAVDAILAHGYNVAYLYVVTVLISGLSNSRKVVVRTALGAVGLTIAAHFLKGEPHTSTPLSSLWFSRGVAVLVIALTALVVVLVLERERENATLGRALRAAERDRDMDKRMLAAASDVASIGTWSIDADDDRFDWSDAAAEIHGWPPGTRPTRDDVLATMPEADARRMRQAINDALDAGTPFREECLVRLADGDEKWIVMMGEAVRDPGRSLMRVHGTVQDVTRWREAELSATSLNHRFSQMTQALPIIVWTANAKGEIDYFNEALLRYTGSTADQLLADQWVSVVDPRDLERVTAAWSRAVETGSPYDLEFRVRGADGAFRWHHLAAEPEHDDDGAVVRWWGSSINVDATHTLRERADELASEREMILESMSDGVLALDPEWRVIYMNSSAELILDLGRDRLEGAIFWDMYPDGLGTPAHSAMVTTMDVGVPARVAYFSECIGKWLDVAVSRSPGGVTVFIRDITELRELSEQLALSQRLEAVGQLTGGIAHDFNNLLTVVWGGADALLSDPSVDGEAKEMAELIASAAERAAELTHRLLAFARKQPLEPRAIDLNARVGALEPLLRRTLGEHIHMVVAPCTEPAVADVDPGQFENALLNLTINASDAMPDGGNLTVDVAAISLDADYVTAHAQVEPGHYVVVTVTDSGKGIPAADLSRLFDPFFTTKGLGKGSGLGLAMVWGFIKQSGGNITVYSEEGIGTSFKMYLPAAASAATVADVEPPRASSGPHVGTILVAEDDELVRRFATERLRAHGYTVVEASSGPEALEALATLPRLDLLFTDVVMPGGMTGRQLADAVVERRPGTPVLYASGYTENVILHNGRLDVGVRLVSKPYSTRQLIDRVGEALAGAPGGPS